MLSTPSGSRRSRHPDHLSTSEWKPISGRVALDPFNPLNSVSGLAGGANTNYFSVPAGGYNAAGQPTQLTYGNGIQGLLGYNDHMQVSSIEYKTSAGADLLNLSAYN